LVQECQALISQLHASPEAEAQAVIGEGGRERERERERESLGGEWKGGRGEYSKAEDKQKHSGK
jgi:hypothetical protein